MDLKSVIDRNREIRLGLSKRNVESVRESMRESYGVDLSDEKTFNFKSPFFSWKGFREGAYRVASRHMIEAQGEGVFNALLRAGINTITNGWYDLVETNHEKIVAMTTSTHAVEPYAPVHRGSVPRRVPRGTPFPEVKVAGPLDLQLLNEKFGAITAIEKELLDDDQSGIIQQRVQDIGPNMAILEDAWAFQRFIGTAGSYGGDVIPASQTYTTVWTTTLTGGGSNRLSPYVAFTSDQVQALDLLLMNQKDLLGNLMLVNPNTLLVGTNLKFAARTLLNSEWYPSTAALKIGGGSGVSTAIGTTYARNVLDGAYNLVVSRFFDTTNHKAYALGEAGKGIVFQMREGLSVVNENPQSGPAFSQDEFRFRAKARWAVDWIDPRFWALGNDGSI
jgi:hypothetical protein